MSDHSETLPSKCHPEPPSVGHFGGSQQTDPDGGVQFSMISSTCGRQSVAGNRCPSDDRASTPLRLHYHHATSGAILVIVGRAQSLGLK